MALELNKEFLNRKSQEYTQPSSIVTKIDIYKKNSSKFLKNLNKTPLYYIKEVLDAKPEYALESHLKHHFLHYAAKTNDPDLINFAINKSIQAGLKNYPDIEMNYRYNSFTFDIFNFCILNNLDNAYATFLSRLSQPENSSFQEHYNLSLENNSKCLKFLNNIIDTPNKQLWIHSFFSDKIINKDYHALEYIMAQYDYSIYQLVNTGLDLHYCGDNQLSYFDIFCDNFLNNFTYETLNKKDTFVDKTLQMYHYFLDNGFILDSPTHPITKSNPRAAFEQHINFFKSKSHMFEKEYNFASEIITINKKSLENELNISNNLQNEVIGVEMSLVNRNETKKLKLKL